MTVFESVGTFTVVCSHLDGRLVSRDVHDHLLRQQELVQRRVDERLPRPRIVRFLRVDTADFTPFVKRFLYDFGANVYAIELFLPFAEFFQKLCLWISYVLDQIAQVAIPTTDVSDDGTLGHSIHPEVDLDQRAP